MCHSILVRLVTNLTMRVVRLVPVRWGSVRLVPVRLVPRGRGEKGWGRRIEEGGRKGVEGVKEEAQGSGRKAG